VLSERPRRPGWNGFLVKDLPLFLFNVEIPQMLSVPLKGAPSPVVHVQFAHLQEYHSVVYCRIQCFWSWTHSQNILASDASISSFNLYVLSWRSDPKLLLKINKTRVLFVFFSFIKLKEIKKYFPLLERLYLFSFPWITSLFIAHTHTHVPSKRELVCSSIGV